MDDQGAGRLLRALRHRRRWRQQDLAERDGISQSTQSLIERGHLDHLTLGTIRRSFATCDASVRLDVAWRGGEIDRVLDAAHAELVDAIGRHLSEAGWTVEFEVSSSSFGERGSIDILAFRDDVVLVVEVKSELTSIEETLRRLDQKVRLAQQIAFERFGRRVRIVGRLLVLPEGSTSRDRVARHAAIFDRALPARGHAVKAWLADPRTSLSGLWFFRITSHQSRMGRRPAIRKRIRVRPSAAEHASALTTRSKGPNRHAPSPRLVFRDETGRLVE